MCNLTLAGPCARWRSLSCLSPWCQQFSPASSIVTPLYDETLSSPSYLKTLISWSLMGLRSLPTSSRRRRTWALRGTPSWWSSMLSADQDRALILHWLGSQLRWHPTARHRGAHLQSLPPASHGTLQIHPVHLRIISSINANSAGVRCKAAGILVTLSSAPTAI